MNSQLKGITNTLHRAIASIEYDQKNLLLYVAAFLLTLLIVTVLYGLIFPMAFGMRHPGTGGWVILGLDQASAKAMGFFLTTVLSISSILWLFQWLFKQWGIGLSLPRLVILATLPALPYLLSRLFLFFSIFQPLADLTVIIGFFILGWILRDVFRYHSLLRPLRFLSLAGSMVLLFSCFSVLTDILLPVF